MVLNRLLKIDGLVWWVHDWFGDASKIPFDEYCQRRKRVILTIAKELGIVKKPMTTVRKMKAEAELGPNSETAVRDLEKWLNTVCPNFSEQE